MNLGTMRTRLRNMVGNPSTAEVADSDLNTLINDSLLEVQDRFTLNEGKRVIQFTTVSGTEKYSVPPDCMAVLSVTDVTNKNKLTKRGDRWASTHFFTQNAKPTDYVRYVDWIQLYPTPDGAYTFQLYYKNTHTVLINDADTPTIPTAWHKGILHYARYMYYDELKIDFKFAEYYMGVFNRWIATKPSEVGEESVDIDTGVELPTLSLSTRTRYDFDHSD